MQPVIVGIDPGTTTAFAVLSFDLKILRVLSKKNYSLSKLIYDVYEYGNPIIVGTDKKFTPRFIKEFSQKTGAVIHKTKYDTKKGEKKHIVQENKFSDFVKNAHETDALASAIYAYKDYQPLINKINKYVKNNNKQDIKDKIFLKVIVEAKNLTKSVKEIEVKPLIKEKEQQKPRELETDIPLSKEQKEIILLNKLVKKLRTKINLVIRENEKLSQKKIDIGKETKKIISFKEKRALELENQLHSLKKELKSKNDSIKNLNILLSKSKEEVLIKKLENLSSKEFEIKKNILNIKDKDILLVKDISISSKNLIKYLSDRIEIIIYEKGNNRDLDTFLLINRKNFQVFESEYFALIDKKLLEAEIKKALLGKKKSPMFIKELLDEYKRERLKDII